MIKDGVFKFDKMIIAPGMSLKTNKVVELFYLINLNNSKVYLAKEKMCIGEDAFWITITTVDGIVRKFELSNADEKY